MKTKDARVTRGRGLPSWRALTFVAVAAGLSGYFLFRARREPPPRAVRAPETATQEPKSLGAGDALRPVSLLSLSGERLELRPPRDSQPVLLYIFSPTCSICTNNLPVWKELFVEAESRSVEVVGISVLDPVRTADYVRQHQLPWKVYSVAGQESIQALGVERVPLTVLVEGTGKVGLAVRGALDSEHRSAISQFLQRSAG